MSVVERSSPWQMAHDAAGKAGVELRPLRSLADADAILRVMQATWGEQIPRETIRALAGSGNVPWGAFDGDDLVGYVLGWAAVSSDDGLHEHSHMLAALPDRRHRGVGYALKLAQRASCLDRGIHLVRWTFDPLVARNAHLNLGKLGATCDGFHRDYYGAMPDAINAGDRSDRLIVRWDLDAEPEPRPIPERDEVSMVVVSSGPVDAPRPEPCDPDPDASVVAVHIPRDHAAIRTADPALGAAWRDVVGEALERSFRSGFEAAAFDADRFGGRPFYVLSRTT